MCKSRPFAALFACAVEKIKWPHRYDNWWYRPTWQTCNKKKTPLASKKKDNRKEGSAKKDQAHSTTVNPFFFFWISKHQYGFYLNKLNYFIFIKLNKNYLNWMLIKFLFQIKCSWTYYLYGSHKSLCCET